MILLTSCVLNNSILCPLRPVKSVANKYILVLSLTRFPKNINKFIMKDLLNDLSIDNNYML